MITKEEYTKNKEYWDYQRLKEYNRELTRKEAEELCEHYDMDVDKMFELMWSEVDDDDYQTPVVGWEPKNIEYRVDNS